MSNVNNADAEFSARDGAGAFKPRCQDPMMCGDQPEDVPDTCIEAFLTADFDFNDEGSAVHASDRVDPADASPPHSNGHYDDYSEVDESGSVSVASLPWRSESDGQASPDINDPSDIVGRDSGQSRKRARPDDAVLPQGRRKSPAVALSDQNARRVRERKFAKRWHSLLNPFCEVLGLSLLKPKDRNIGIKGIGERINALYLSWEGTDPERQRELAPLMQDAANALRDALDSEDYLDPRQLMATTGPLPDSTRACKYKYKQDETEKAIKRLQDFAHKTWAV